MLTLIGGLTSAELKGDLSLIARTRGGRKIMRLLESMSIPPFATATELIGGHDDLDVAALALLTVSSWEPDVPTDTVRHCRTLESREAQARHMQEVVNPMQWLSAMPNNLLCQVATALGCHGPNAHWVGDGAALGLCLQFTEGLLSRGAAPAALVVTFDPPPGVTRLAPDTVPSAAAALLVATTGEGPRIDVGKVLATGGGRAVDVAASIVKALGHRDTWQASSTLPGRR